jgi:hypothetical protein
MGKHELYAYKSGVEASIRAWPQEKQLCCCYGRIAISYINVSLKVLLKFFIFFHVLYLQILPPRRKHQNLRSQNPFHTRRPIIPRSIRFLFPILLLLLRVEEDDTDPTALILESSEVP